jgi:hypothetical protein
VVPGIKTAVSWACAAILAIFAILFVLDWNTPPRDPVSGSISASAGSDKDLLVRGFLDRNRLHPGEKLRLHLIFENHSAAAVRVGIRDIQRPGFGAIAIPPPFDLNAGTSQGFDLDLTPADGGRFKIAVLSQVTRSSGGVEESILSLGPVEIRTALGDWIDHSVAPAKQIYSVIKDFTLPVVLAVLAYFFQRHQSARDAKAARDRETRETRQQIWSNQIPRFRTFAEKHYLPIVSNIRHLRKDFNAFNAAPPAEQDGEAGIKLLYRVLMVLRRMAYLRDEEGSVFFQIRRAELIVQNAWWAVNLHVEDQFRVDRRDRVLSLLAPDEPYHHFLEIAADEPVFEELRLALLLWVRQSDDFTRCLDLTHMMLAVFGFEANRPFDEYWYGTPDEFEGKALADYKFPAEPKERVEKLKTEYAAYVIEVNDYVSKWVKA